MIFVLLGIAIVYVLTISWLIYGFTQVPLYKKQEVTPKTTFSILVPFRNEAENLPILLESISKLKYPTDLFEVLLIDDASEEKFQILNSKFQITLTNTIRQSNSPKKDAITTGVPLAKNEWIITTDADCVVPENWLLTFDNYIQNHAVSMLVSAVTYDCENSFLHHFQQLDLMSLQGATMGSFGLGKGFMCNGANFGYTKSFFQALDGFAGNDKIASGDDVFLLQKAMTQYPEKVHYLKSKNTTVTTKPVNDWKSLFYQRVRWASKTGSYQSRFGIGLGLVVFWGNFAWVLGIGYWVLGFGIWDLGFGSWVLGFGFWNLDFGFWILALGLLSKFIVDFILIAKTHHFLSTAKIRYFVLSGFVYPFFSIAVALYSLLGTYEWKGRRFEK